MARTANQIHDEWLVLRCQAGDLAGFEELVRRWQRRLWRHVYHLTDGHEDAADVLQEVWMAVARKLKRLEDPACFPHWVYRIATARCADWVRKQKRERSLRSAVADEVVSTNHSRYDKTDRDNRMGILNAAITRLPSDQRAILRMFYLDEFSTAEIAMGLAIPIGTVKSRLHHARNHLRQLIERSEL